MNKQTILNVILSVAVIIALVLNFTSPTSEVNGEKEVEAQQDPKEDVVEVVDSLSEEIKKAGNAKIAYFVLEELVSMSPYLSRKTNELMSKEQNLIQDMKSKEQELKNLQLKTQKELEELDQKKLLNQTYVQNAQDKIMKKQQEMQLDLQQQEEKLNQSKQAFVKERDEVIFEAVQEINEVMDLDYVLIDNMELRIVVPLSDRNNITKEVANVINKKYK